MQRTNASNYPGTCSSSLSPSSARCTSLMEASSVPGDIRSPDRSLLKLLLGTSIAHTNKTCSYNFFLKRFFYLVTETFKSCVVITKPKVIDIDSFIITYVPFHN